MIRIAHIVEATTGGVARHVIDLVAHLDAAEFSNTVYLSLQRPESWREPLRALADQGRTLREIAMTRVPSAATVRQISGWLCRDAVDIVHVHSAKAGYLGRQAAALCGIPAIYTPHAFPFQRTTDWRRPVYRMVERQLARQTEAIICVSAGERAEGLLAGLPDAKMVVIPNGIDTERWPLPSEAQRREARAALGVTSRELVIGAMGRLVPQKGFDLLLAAAEEFLPDFPLARVIIWGDGPEHRRLQQMAKRLRLRRVMFCGDAHDPWLAYAAMDIYCAPSRWEAGPYAVLEAMACGVAIVASDVAGHADYLVAGESGLVVPAELPGPLDGAIRALLYDADERADLGEAARQRVAQEFTLTRMVAATADLYRRVKGEE